MSNKLNPNAKSVEEYLREDAEEEKGTEEAPAKEEAKDPIEEIASKFPGAPGAELLRKWKEFYKGLYAYIPDNDVVYLFRSVKRLEHKGIMHDLRNQAESARAKEDPEFLQEQHHERLVNLCLLHPTVTAEFFRDSEAGLIPTIFNLIMENSKFVSAEKALSTTYKL